MSREVRRVPLDFEFPTGQTWPGYLRSEPTDPPAGQGYQLWQTVSEGGPVSPVYATPEELADWIIGEGDEFDGANTPREKLIAWIAAEGVSAGSLVVTGGRVVSGVEFAANHDEGGGQP